MLAELLLEIRLARGLFDNCVDIVVVVVLTSHLLPFCLFLLYSNESNFYCHYSTSYHYYHSYYFCYCNIRCHYRYFLFL